MLTIEQARHAINAEPDIAELLREYAEVEHYYREAVAAMVSPETEIEPVLNSADVTVSFQTVQVVLDMRQNNR